MELSLKTAEDFDETMRAYIPTVYRIAFERLGNAADAEDVTQEVFIRYFKADKTFESEEHRRYFLIRIAVNCANSFAKTAWYRHRAYSEELEIPIFDDNASVSAEKIEERNAVLSAVIKLPEKYRTVVHLFYFEELSISDIAKIIGKSENTVKSQLSRAREKLKKLLNREDFE